MNLVVDIGNTLTKLAWFKNGKLIETQRIELTARELIAKRIAANPVDRIIVSSVGNGYDDIFTALSGRVENLVFFDHTTPLPLNVLYKSPETLGLDRIAAAVGAWYIFPGSNMLVIDMGTAITIDIVTASGEFRGGNISPGLHARFRSLNEFTARLPLVSKDHNFPQFGNDTNSAIAAGVQQGIIYEVSGYIDDFENSYPDCNILITGGDAEFFVPKLKRTIFAVPDLVLTGLNNILEFITPE
jgi:type III pantothenate kinase